MKKLIALCLLLTFVNMGASAYYKHESEKTALQLLELQSQSMEIVILMSDQMIKMKNKLDKIKPTPVF